MCYLCHWNKHSGSINSIIAVTNVTLQRAHPSHHKKWAAMTVWWQTVCVQFGGEDMKLGGSGKWEQGGEQIGPKKEEGLAAAVPAEIKSSQAQSTLTIALAQVQVEQQLQQGLTLGEGNKCSLPRTRPQHVGYSRCHLGVSVLLCGKLGRIGLPFTPCLPMPPSSQVQSEPDQSASVSIHFTPSSLIPFKKIPGSAGHAWSTPALLVF